MKQHQNLWSGAAQDVQRHEAMDVAFARKFDDNLLLQGFELGGKYNEASGKYEGGTYGLHGPEVEEYFFHPYGKPYLPQEPESVKKIEDKETMVRDALAHNPHGGKRYDQWRLHARPWLVSLMHYIEEDLKNHPALQKLNLSPDFIRRMVKPVASGGRSADVHYGADMFFIFHDPVAFKEFHKQGGGPQEESQYWSPEADTIVTIDGCADIAYKEKRMQEKGHLIQADILASKIGQKPNMDLARYLDKTGGEIVEKNEDQRMKNLAKLVVDMYFVKKNRKLDNFRNPEQERRDAEEKQREREKEIQRKWHQEKIRADLERAIREKDKKAKNKEKSKNAKDEKLARKKSGGMTPPSKKR